MIFFIMVLGRHLVMYWAPEKKSCKRALEVHKKWEKVFFSESSPQILYINISRNSHARSEGRYDECYS